jgi:hypothetical protein
MFLCYGIVILIVATYGIFWRKVLKIYWVWCGLGIFFFAYMFCFRYLPNIIELASGAYKNPNWHAPALDDNGQLIIVPCTIEKSLSDVLLLDMCPFMGMVIPILFIFDKKKKILLPIAPWAIFGGALSLFGQTFNDFQGRTELANFSAW